MKQLVTVLIFLSILSTSLQATTNVDTYHCDMSMVDGRFVEFAVMECSIGLNYSIKSFIKNDVIKLSVKEVEEGAGFTRLHFSIPGMDEDFAIEYNLGFRDMMKEYAAGMWFTGTGNMPCELK